jgi:hypothetical protein
VGIFIAWILQKRWLTLSAFVLNVIAIFVLRWLPSPYSYLVVLPPAILVSALFYEGAKVFALRITSRLRIAWALWMGLSALALMVGVVLSGSNTLALIGSVAIFAVLSMTAIVAVAVAHARGLQVEQQARSRVAASQAPPRVS